MFQYIQLAAMVHKREVLLHDAYDVPPYVRPFNLPPRAPTSHSIHLQNIAPSAVPSSSRYRYSASLFLVEREWGGVCKARFLFRSLKMGDGFGCLFFLVGKCHSLVNSSLSSFSFSSLIVANMYIFRREFSSGLGWWF